MKKEKQTKNVHTKWTLHTYKLFCFALFIKFSKELFGLIKLFCPSPYCCAFSGQKLNHRVCEVGKHFWRPPGPNLLLKQEYPGQGAQAHVQVDFEDIRGGDYTTSLDNVCQCSITCTVRSASWCSGGSFCVSVCAQCLLSCPWQPLKIVWLHPLCTVPSDIYRHC